LRPTDLRDFCLLNIKIDALQAGGAKAASGNGNKKVLVSGCFDLLHSGHVEFFKEAAEHGDLYVFCGSDANIQSLKNHLPLYNNQERVFMCQNIKWVKQAAVSCGEGRYDFIEDMKALKPDIYFCNEDASALDGRVKICEELGIEMIVKV
jgi:cytidyltransferase-like protein